VHAQLGILRFPRAETEAPASDCKRRRRGRRLQMERFCKQKDFPRWNENQRRIRAEDQSFRMYSRFSRILMTRNVLIELADAVGWKKSEVRKLQLGIDRLNRRTAFQASDVNYTRAEALGGIIRRNNFSVSCPVSFIAHASVRLAEWRFSALHPVPACRGM